MKIFITADFSEESVARLRQMGHDVKLGGWGFTGEILDEDTLIRELGDSEVLIVGYEPVTKRVLDSSKLRAICSIRGGPRANINVDYCSELKIPVTYTKGREAIPVADFTMGQIISLVRQITRTDRELRSGKFTAVEKEYGSDKDVIWDMSDEGPWQSRKGIELAGKIHGLIGFGTVGQEVAKRAVGFGLTVIAFDPYQPDEVFVKQNAKKVDLVELLKESDIISIHAQINDANKGMIGEEEFLLMKQGVYLINNARASIVDEKALRNAIATGKVGGAALDVHHDEPIKASDPLLKLDNVILTPHIAGAGLEVIYRHSRMVVDDLLRLIEGKMPDAIANPEVLRAGTVF